MSALHPLLAREELAALYDPIATDLAQVDRILTGQLRSSIAFIDELTSRVRGFHGKRIRPVLLLLSAQACGGVRPEHHTLAAVIEMIHVATLVHDDLLDGADTRRHMNTVNAEWGDEASVLLGDYLFSQAYYLAATLETTTACQIIGEATNRTCEGELRQISHRGDFQLSESEYLEILAGKTARLIECCCRLGAQFAGGDENVVDSMGRFGQKLGVSFQIVDDLLDIVGRADETGKSIGTDWAKRKMTLPAILLRDRGAPWQVEQLRSLFEDESNRHREVLALLSQSQAFEMAEQVARRLASEAETELNSLPASVARGRLSRIAQFVTHRSY